jgi:hypothetical protein
MRILAVVRGAGVGRRTIVAGIACLLAAWLAEAADTGVVWDERGRRDPFEYAAAEEPAPVRKDDDNGGDPPDPPPPAPDLAAEAARFVAESLARLESRRHAAVWDEAATLMAKLRRAGLEGTGGYERLARVCETAGRLARRSSSGTSRRSRSKCGASSGTSGTPSP